MLSAGAFVDMEPGGKLQPELCLRQASKLRIALGRDSRRGSIPEFKREPRRRRGGATALLHGAAPPLHGCPSGYRVGAGSFVPLAIEALVYIPTQVPWAAFGAERGKYVETLVRAAAASRGVMALAGLRVVKYPRHPLRTGGDTFL